MCILQLSKKYSAKRFNDACGHVLSTDKINYYAVRKILSNTSADLTHSG